jgi:hypothetical protein
MKNEKLSEFSLGFIWATAAIAAAALIMFCLYFYAKPYFKRKRRLKKYKSLSTRKISWREKFSLWWSELELSTYLIPIVIGSIVLYMLYLVFCKHSNSSAPAISWVWIIIVCLIILLGVIIFKHKDKINLPDWSRKQATTASASTPSATTASSGSNFWKVAGVIVLCALGLGWYLKHASNNKNEARETTDLPVNPYAGMTIIEYGKAQPLKAGIKYRYDRADGQHVFTPYKEDTHVSPPVNIDDRWHYITVDKNDLVWVTKEILPSL